MAGHPPTPKENTVIFVLLIFGVMTSVVLGTILTLIAEAIDTSRHYVKMYIRRRDIRKYRERNNA